MRITLTSLCCALLILLGAFIPKQPKKFIPPGTVLVNDTFYFGQNEVSNKDWKEFVSSAGKEALPDTLVWRQEFPASDPYKEDYRDKKYEDHPVVGITYEQAVAYCKWKTESVQQEMKANAFKKEMLPISFKYRLPTKQEWELAANAGPGEKEVELTHSKRWGHFQNNNMISYTDRPDTVKAKPNPDAMITAPVYMYFPNKLGIHNLSGNVAEMVSEKGIAKGGGWNHRRDEASVEKDYPYDSATAWLGFRCVCEVKW
jgi:formylglycine-generating enzyme required for sulfatase activity